MSQSSSRKALLESRARFMRFNATWSEAKLWHAIRGKRLGVQFRRQQVVMGDHIVDFLCRKPPVAVEVDGDAYHAHRQAADAARDRKLQRAGYMVVRVPASLVSRNLPAALQLIKEALG